MKRSTKPRIPSIACPHCRGRAIARSSNAVTEICREIHFRCDNDECGHGFVAQLAIVRTTTRSKVERAGIHLPFSNPRRMPTPANDDAEVVIPPAANDTEMRDTG